jgi:hypothetical protein
MQQILFQEINVEEFKKMLSDVIEEKLKFSPRKELPEKQTIYLNRFEVVELLKISLPTLNNWSKSGIVQAYRIGNRVLYKADEIGQAIQSVKNLKYKRK